MVFEETKNQIIIMIVCINIAVLYVSLTVVIFFFTLSLAHGCSRDLPRTTKWLVETSD